MESVVCSPESLPTLLKRLVELADAEQVIVDAMSEAVRRNDRVETFRLAAELIARAGHNKKSD